MIETFFDVIFSLYILWGLGYTISQALIDSQHGYLR